MPPCTGKLSTPIARCPTCEVVPGKWGQRLKLEAYAVLSWQDATDDDEDEKPRIDAAVKAKIALKGLQEHPRQVLP